MSRQRIREMGLVVGALPPGRKNAITDVEGVRVGHTTLVSGDGPLHPGKGPVRTGVTVVLPHGGNLFAQKVPAAVYTINGFGKVCGFEQVRELGTIESPIALTNTMNVGLVMDALIQYTIQHNPEVGIRTSSVNVIVGETNDGFLNDLQGRHVRAGHVLAAIKNASKGPVIEGAVGAGTGTTCLGWKGGIGTASRIVPQQAGGFRLGALVQTNFGSPEDLVVLGFPVGRHLSPPGPSRDQAQEEGSVMIVLATDAPLDARQLRRLCVRAAAGLARVGGYYGHGSGDFVIAFSTANQIEHKPDTLMTARSSLADEAAVMQGLFLAVVESVEEAVLNSLSCAETMIGRDGHIAHALPLEKVVSLLKQQYLNL